MFHTLSKTKNCQEIHFNTIIKYRKVTTLCSKNGKERYKNEASKVNLTTFHLPFFFPELLYRLVTIEKRLRRIVCKYFVILIITSGFPVPALVALTFMGGFLNNSYDLFQCEHVACRALNQDPTMAIRLIRRWMGTKHHWGGSVVVFLSKKEGWRADLCH